MWWSNIYTEILEIRSPREGGCLGQEGSWLSSIQIVEEINGKAHLCIVVGLG
jgi:hypothetical protein